MDAPVHIESPKKDKSRIYLPRNKSKQAIKRGIVKKSSSKVQKSKNFRSHSPVRSPILPLSPVWSPSRAEQENMNSTTKQRHSSTCVDWPQSGHSTTSVETTEYKGPKSSTLFDLYFDKSVSNLLMLAEVAIIRHDENRMCEIDNVVQTEQILSDIEDMLNKNVQYFVPIADAMSKVLEKDAKKSAEDPADCTIGEFHVGFHRLIICTFLAVCCTQQTLHDQCVQCMRHCCDMTTL